MNGKNVDFRLTDEQREEAGKHIGLLVLAVNKAKRNILEFKDQVQEAAFGMMRAVQLHDPSRSKISTYATRSAINSIKKAERRHGLIRVPDYLTDKASKSNKLREFIGAARNVSSLERGNEVACDQFQDDDTAERLQAVRDSIEHLTPAQKRIVSALYFDGDTVKQVARRFKIKESTVRRMKNKAFVNLRRMLKHVA